MACDTESPKYAPLYDEAKQASPCGLYLLRKVGPVLIVIGFVTFAGFMSGSTSVAAPMAFMNNSFNAATDLAQKTDLEVLHHFKGDTGQYKVFPGGHLSATLQSVHSGSKSTLFLLDHRLEYIVHGEIHIADGTGQSFKGKAGDLFYLPYGSNVTFSTSKKALVYTAIADKVTPIVPSQVPTLKPEAYRKWADVSARSTPVSHFPQLRDRSNKAFHSYVKKLSPHESSAYFDMAGCFKWNGTELPSNIWSNSNKSFRLPTWNFCCGVFRLKEGPAFTSAKYNHHDEIDFILDGKFHYKDANGGKFVLEKGDLVHNPRRMDVSIETPGKAEFLSISMSNVDDFWR